MGRHLPAAVMSPRRGMLARNMTKRGPSHRTTGAGFAGRGLAAEAHPRLEHRRPRPLASTMRRGVPPAAGCTMIDALDHIAVRVPAASRNEALSAFEAVLGRVADRTDHRSALIVLANMALAIEADLGPGQAASLTRLAFRCPDLARAERVLARRAVAFERSAAGLAIAAASSNGVPILLCGHHRPGRNCRSSRG